MILKIGVYRGHVFVPCQLILPEEKTVSRFFSMRGSLIFAVICYHIGCVYMHTVSWRLSRFLFGIIFGRRCYHDGFVMCPCFHVDPSE